VKKKKRKRRKKEKEEKRGDGKGDCEMNEPGRHNLEIRK
jgi:hypothetical protein